MFLLFLHLKNGDTIEKDGRLIVDYPLNDLNGAMHLYPVYIHIYIVYVGEDHIIHQLGPPMNQAGFFMEMGPTGDLIQPWRFLQS